MKLRTLVRLAQESSSDPTQIEMGIKVEMEHRSTIEWLKSNPDATIEEAARHIALDHLKELPDYYSRLKQMENKG
jgi:hypothetical protein